MLNLYAFFVCALLLTARIICIDRTCTCQRVYAVNKQEQVALPVLKVVSDDLDVCDSNCVDTCSQEIRSEIGGDPNAMTTAGLERMCADVSDAKSLHKDGIRLINKWELDLCALDSLTLLENVCCRQCTCKLAYLPVNRLG